MSVRKFIGLFQIGMLDLAMGASIAHLLHILFYGDHASAWVYVVGAALGALPDLDLLFPLVRRSALDLTHRNTFFHQPLLLMGIPTLFLLFVSAPAFWILFWALPLLWHYLHDTVGESMGVQWLYPFSRTKFAVYDADKKGRRRWFLTHPESYSGMTLDKALQKKFYRLTPTSVLEPTLAAILIIAIAATW